MGHHPLSDSILQALGHAPTQDQVALATQLGSFMDSGQERCIFLLKGYAGTGKTSMISSLVKALFQRRTKVVLLAPTGRAAKVLANYSGTQASTIHRKIYQVAADDNGHPLISLQPNRHTHTLFLVDEASMIAGQKDAYQSNLFGGMNLLDDLVSYVYSGKACRMILIGDTAQLPPVHTLESPALNADYLRHKYKLSVSAAELTQVVRQARQSGILHHATMVRMLISGNHASYPPFQPAMFPDFVRLQGEDVMDAINDAFAGRETEQALVVCRSNKRARLYNQNIRHRVLYREEEINSGDLLLAVKNNYFWLPSNSPAGFIANGDMLEIKRIRRITRKYGFRFAEATVRLIDYQDQPDTDLMLLLDTLHTDTPSLGQQEYKRLLDSVMADKEGSPGRRKKESLRENPYLQALQVKFAYALTCHKAQGGQWDKVFVDLGYDRGQAPDMEALRWLYTAITRASETIYLLNFGDAYFRQETL